MSTLGDAARINLLLSDYAAADAANKINVLGLGWQVTRILPETGLTAPHALVVTIDVPPGFAGDEFSFEVGLYDTGGDLVEAPGPSGEPAPIRIGQAIVTEAPVFQGHYVPKGEVWCHNQAVINFAGGLPLAVGNTYEWRVSIDGNHDERWTMSLHVAGSAPGPVIG